MIEPTDAQTPIALDVQGHSDRPLAYRVRFATEDQALAHVGANPDLYFTEVESQPVPNSCERLLALLYPQCSHGMSLALCYGPAHYATDEEIAQGW